MILQKNIVAPKGKILNSYFNDIRGIEMISQDDEISLFKDLESNPKDSITYKNSFDKIVKGNLRFVVSVAKQYSNMGIPVEDLISEGNIGIIEAVQRYSLDKNVRFISYAIWWIRLKIRSAISENSRTVRLPVNRIDLISKVVDFVVDFEQEHQREPVVDELKDYFKSKYSKFDLKGAMEYYQNHLAGDLIISSNFEFSTTSTNYWYDSDAVDFNIIRDESYKGINEAIMKLSEVERQIIKLKYGLFDHTVESVKSIQSSLGISRNEYLYQLNNAIKKLKKYLKNADLHL